MSTESPKTTCPNCERVEQRVAHLEAQVIEMAGTIEKLTAALEESRRSGKRQAAPFRKKRKKKNPKKPGRKSGASHGKHSHRDSIADDDVDEIVDAPLPRTCPECESDRIIEQGIAHQYQTEIPRRPIRRRIDVHVGECTACGIRVQGRHELQTSDALGAAASQLGADAHAALSLLNKEMGLSHGKSAKVFKRLFGIEIVRSTSVRSILRTARRCEVAYDQIKEIARASPWNVPDETGWRINGENAWLHVTVSKWVTCYMIAKSRSHKVLASVLGKEYSGTMIHDGFKGYDCFLEATHQQCLAHLLRRCEDLLEVATRQSAHFPQDVKVILKEALQLRDRYRRSEISGHGLLSMRGRLTKRMRRLVGPTQPDEANERFALHLFRHRDHLFNFLTPVGIDATNFRAEQAIRPAVVNRKVWGGNRTEAGALAQSILMSVIVSCHQNALDSLEFISGVLCNSHSMLPLPDAR